jgi:hypothetical protein
MAAPPAAAAATALQIPHPATSGCSQGQSGCWPAAAARVAAENSTGPAAAWRRLHGGVQCKAHTVKTVAS